MKQSTLIVDTGLKQKDRNNPYPRTDGKTFSFKVVICGKVFYSMSFFGTDDAIKNAKQKILDNWPDKPEIEITE